MKNLNLFSIPLALFSLSIFAGNAGIADDPDSFETSRFPFRVTVLDSTSESHSGVDLEAIKIRAKRMTSANRSFGDTYCAYVSRGGPERYYALAKLNREMEAVLQAYRDEDAIFYRASEPFYMDVKQVDGIVEEHGRRIAVPDKFVGAMPHQRTGVLACINFSFNPSRDDAAGLAIF